MPADVQRKMEQAFGVSLAAVQIHEDGDAEALGARAFTRGTDIHFAPGEYQPNTQSGQELLGHELAHVVQQAQGVVQPNTQLSGIGLNDASDLEREADQAGAMAARDERVALTGGADTVPAAAAATVQRKISFGTEEEATPVPLEDAQQLASVDDMTWKLVEWYVRYLHDDKDEHRYADEGAFKQDVLRFVDTWKTRLQELGFRDDSASDDDSNDDSSNQPTMSDAFEIYNREGPRNAEALIHKLDKRYRFLRERWIDDSGADVNAHYTRGTIYDPIGKHTMPQNYVWIASVIHQQRPVRVIVPIDFRVLVRKAISEELAGSLGIEGPLIEKKADGDLDDEQDGEKEKKTKKKIRVLQDQILKQESPPEAPLSATTREILGFLHKRHYRADRTIVTEQRCETVLEPNGTPLLDLAEVFTPESMKYEDLCETLARLGIEIRPDEAIAAIHRHYDEAQDAEWWNTCRWVGKLAVSAAVAALAVWGGLVWFET